MCEPPFKRSKIMPQAGDAMETMDFNFEVTDDSDVNDGHQAPLNVISAQLASTVSLTDLPGEIMMAQICPFLELPDVLALRQSNKALLGVVDWLETAEIRYCSLFDYEKLLSGLGEQNEVGDDDDDGSDNEFHTPNLHHSFDDYMYKQSLALYSVCSRRPEALESLCQNQSITEGILYQLLEMFVLFSEDSDETIVSVGHILLHQASMVGTSFVGIARSLGKERIAAALEADSRVSDEESDEESG